MCNGKAGSGAGGYGQPGGAMGQPGVQPTPRVGQFPGGGLPPQLQGTGGVRSPAGPYGPPGFVGGSVPVGAAQPYGADNSLTGGPPAPYGRMGAPYTGGGVGTTMQPNTGGLQPSDAANGPRLPPIPPGTDPFVAQNWGFLHSTLPASSLPTSPEWFSSPAGLAQQRALATRTANNVLPGVMNGSHFTGQHQAARPDPRTNTGEGYVSPYAASKGAQSAQSQSNWANPDWRMQQVMAGKIAPTNNAELQAMLAGMSPTDRDAYVAKYQSVGLNPLFQGGGGSGPFGN